ncbi:hypothetical protein MKZ38_009418 [Zalerion maritima]|uniref:Uncharacterized protein n=1 Tax=Zalerion maritima TaxID=339359 RepID=A0AAD5RU86_9PEZI|nr:hypothetical protein MKZ38_009418 [Zalerion maritima]
MDNLKGRMQNFMLNDEEMGKKDDDFSAHHGRGGHHHPRGPGWRPSRVTPTRRSTKRFFILLLVTVGVYLLFSNMPKSDWRDKRHPMYRDKTYSPGQGPPGGWNYIPPRQKGEMDRAKANAESEKKGGHHAEPALGVDAYEGLVEHPNLMTTLHTVKSGRGTNKNVLFAVSSLQSAANVLPLACRMGKEMKNDVHFALMAHSEIDIREVMKMNGVNEKCRVLFHDARIDHPTTSTEKRLKVGVQDALVSMNIYIRPQVIIVDGSATEESHFLEGVHWQAGELDTEVIELPRNPGSSVGWITKLDSLSLAAWNKVNIDILVSASSGTTGSLIRLLKSLAAADYSGVPMPHLTVELPPDLGPATEQFISKFQWPPKRYSTTHTRSQMTLRKRISPRGIGEDEANVRFMESFYPIHPAFHHVLVLSPQVEVEKHYFQYVRYTAFEYRHSLTAILQKWDSRLSGIALDVPATQVDGTTTFSAPKSQTPRTRGQETEFLWQAPVSHAILFVGEKWAELHGLVEQSLTAQRDPSHVAGLLEKKDVSKEWPGWMEYVLRLNRLRGYWMLFPSPASAKALVTVHTEKAMLPEEYARGYEDEKPVSDQWEEETKSQEPLTVTMPGAEQLLPVNDMPVLSWDGDAVGEDEIEKRAREFRAMWRKSVGGCGEGEGEERTRDRFAKDLFCSSKGKTGSDASTSSGDGVGPEDSSGSGADEAGT